MSNDSTSPAPDERDTAFLQGIIDDWYLLGVRDSEVKVEWFEPVPEPTEGWSLPDAEQKMADYMERWAHKRTNMLDVDGLRFRGTHGPA